MERGTYRRPIIPERNIILPPLEPRVHLLRRGNHVREVLDNRITLGLGDPHDLRDEARVKEERVPAGDGICANERVFSCDGLAPDRAADGAGVVGLHVGGVEGC